MSKSDPRVLGPETNSYSSRPGPNIPPWFLSEYGGGCIPVERQTMFPGSGSSVLELVFPFQTSSPVLSLIKSPSATFLKDSVSKDPSQENIPGGHTKPILTFQVFRISRTSRGSVTLLRWPPVLLRYCSLWLLDQSHPVLWRCSRVVHGWPGLFSGDTWSVLWWLRCTHVFERERGSGRTDSLLLSSFTDFATRKGVFSNPIGVSSETDGNEPFKYKPLDGSEVVR